MAREILRLEDKDRVFYDLGDIFSIHSAALFRSHVEKIEEPKHPKQMGQVLGVSQLRPETLLEVSDITADGDIKLKMAFGAVWDKSIIHTSLKRYTRPQEAGLMKVNRLNRP